MSQYHVLTESAALTLGIIDAAGDELHHSAEESAVAAAAESSHASKAEAYAAASIMIGHRWVIDLEGNSKYVVSRLIPLTGSLHDYTTGEYLRAATQAETDASIAAAKRDGGAGVIDAEGRRCYVEGGRATATEVR